MVITGDVTQLDLPRGVSGLKHVRSILEGLHDIQFCDFSGSDVVRHSLVASIVSAYDKDGSRQRMNQECKNGKRYQAESGE